MPQMPTLDNRHADKGVPGRRVPQRVPGVLQEAAAQRQDEGISRIGAYGAAASIPGCRPEDAGSSPTRPAIEEEIMLRKLFRKPKMTSPEPVYLDKIVLCSCGVLLPTQKGLEKHQKLGHFDLPDFELTAEQKEEIARIVRCHGRLSLGRSDQAREVYYFARSGSTPILFWDDDPNVSSAFAKAASAFARQCKMEGR